MYSSRKAKIRFEFSDVPSKEGVFENIFSIPLFENNAKITSIPRSI